MKNRFAPAVRKTWLPCLLIALSVLPSFGIREIVFGTLALPYTWLVGHPPFPYQDKPWFLSPAGALAVAIAWAAIIYIIACLASKRDSVREKEPIQPPEPMRAKGPHGSS
jgi:hypothetical protein